ncbi:excalibur calcium-binding domain-containing protein [Nostoc sp. CHAB 5834]|nr:excalibur calcium-binding domain-containing protein [Nostoc sp. CHAB 5834]
MHVCKQRYRRSQTQRTSVGTWLLLPIAGLALFGLVKPSSEVSPPSKLAQSSTAPASAYYRYCDQARAAGVARLYRGTPGYRPELNRDGDGIVCEPYYGR